MPSDRRPVSNILRNGIVITALLFNAGVSGLRGQALGTVPAGQSPEVISLSADTRQTHPRERGGFTATFGPYTRHTGKGNYNAHPAFTALEWETPTRWTAGAAYFRNSFWQPCWFAFGGRRFTFNGRNDGFFVKVVAGVIHGYRSPHENSVSLNYRANCPAIIPSFGYKFRRVTVQLVVFGTNAGQMPMISRDLR